jgi:hypothetical protein
MSLPLSLIVITYACSITALTIQWRKSRNTDEKYVAIIITFIIAFAFITSTHLFNCSSVLHSPHALQLVQELSIGRIQGWDEVLPSMTMIPPLPLQLRMLRNKYNFSPSSRRRCPPATPVPHRANTLHK